MIVDMIVVQCVSTSCTSVWRSGRPVAGDGVEATMGVVVVDKISRRKEIKSLYWFIKQTFKWI